MDLTPLFVKVKKKYFHFGQNSMVRLRLDKIGKKEIIGCHHAGRPCWHLLAGWAAVVLINLLK